ncbi:TIGR00269 family protein [Methanobacterium congolense]|uniref:CTU1/ATPBD3 family protein MJ1157 n=1 Tax=Methanobacterium congolense TaxID=118062 RepID=A0A1D3L4J8_9EURY|nr:TIGR00269 family protein [Methanobacterium congolense]SCG86551.1 CTU1/ATPBD3 family protein MJ1157 [Methanobacterium congolense]
MKTLDPERFTAYIENTARSVIWDYELIEPGELVVVGLSGGKDSILTLHLLSKFMKDFDFKLKAVSIDEGISGYRAYGIEAARKAAHDMDVELVESSFKEEFGFALDDVVDRYKSGCIPCGVFRRYLLNKTAFKMGADKLATGHNLDDEIQSFLMSFARADFRRFTKFGPKLDRIHPKLVPRIKPLWKIPERDVGIWAVMNEVDVHFAECPYSQTSLRAKMKNYLNNLESRRPGTKLSILQSFEKTFKFHKKQIEMGECTRCGEPSSLNICKACEMVEEIKKEESP